MAQAPTSPEGQSRDELYKNWLAWVTTNLGADAELAATAANAAADAAVRGDGFNAAVEAARNAWIEAAPPDKALWRPSFTRLLLTNLWFWILIGLVISVPFVYVTAFLVPIFLILVGWKAYAFWRLSKRGIVVPGSLFNLETIGRGGRQETYVAAYKFDFHGQYSTSHIYELEDSVRQDVLVLFDPQNPKLAVVMPELLNPGA